MILLIDNYDSFSYNLYQLVGKINPDIKVIRNDEYTCQEIEAMNPDKIIISPGPGRPSDAGICEEAISYFAGKVPILGVCLGHQAICETYGATITYAKKLMHGKMSVANVDINCKLFKGLQKGSRLPDIIPLPLPKKTSRMFLPLSPEPMMMRSWQSNTKIMKYMVSSSIRSRF